MNSMKKIRMIMTLAIVCIVLCACPTDNGHKYITFINKSDREIVCQEDYIMKKDPSEEATMDTLYNCKNGSLYGISADTLYNHGDPTVSWERMFTDMLYLRVLVTDGEAFDKYIESPCDTIRKYLPTLHIYRLTLADLERTNWTVVYPPEKE